MEQLRRGGGAGFAPLTKCLFFFLLLIKSRRDTSVRKKGMVGQNDRELDHSSMLPPPPSSPLPTSGGPPHEVALSSYIFYFNKINYN